MVEQTVSGGVLEKTECGQTDCRQTHNFMTDPSTLHASVHGPEERVAAPLLFEGTQGQGY